MGNGRGKGEMSARNGVHPHTNRGAGFEGKHLFDVGSHVIAVFGDTNWQFWRGGQFDFDIGGGGGGGSSITNTLHNTIQFNPPLGGCG